MHQKHPPAKYALFFEYENDVEIRNNIRK